MPTFNYTTQQWITGPEAEDLRRQQLSDELELLESDRGADYARFMGTDREQAIANVRQQLNECDKLRAEV